MVGNKGKESGLEGEFVVTEEAVEALAEIGGIPEVINDLGGENPALIRAEAAKALEVILHPFVVLELTKALKAKNSDVIRLSAMGVITVVKGEIKAHNDVTELAEQALKALVNMGEVVIPEIEDALMSNSPTVRRVLIDVLEEMGETAALPALGRALNSDYCNLSGLAENALMRMGIGQRKAKAAAKAAPLKHKGPDSKIKPPSGAGKAPQKGRGPLRTNPL